MKARYYGITFNGKSVPLMEVNKQRTNFRELIELALLLVTMNIIFITKGFLGIQQE